jgi:GNAT superfamily N-acetyltransferase
MLIRNMKYIYDLTFIIVNVPMLDNNNVNKIVIRNTCIKDIPEIVDIQRESFSDVATGIVSEPSFLEDHINLFPEGQFCAELNGRIVGSASSLIVLLNPEYCDHSWYDVVGHRGIFRTHNPKGDSLYGDDICIHPNSRRQGIATMLFRARKELAIKLNLKRVIAGGRLYNYCEYADKMSPFEYAQKVVNGELQDQVLSFDLKNGFKYIKIIPDYIYDGRSLNYAAFIEWLNPNYHCYHQQLPAPIQ